jgi:hypothetical protein
MGKTAGKRHPQDWFFPLRQPLSTFTASLHLHSLSIYLLAFGLRRLRLLLYSEVLKISNCSFRYVSYKHGWVHNDKTSLHWEAARYKSALTYDSAVCKLGLLRCLSGECAFEVGRGMSSSQDCREVIAKENLTTRAPSQLLNFMAPV